jgi:O-acetyl-ADP-ribose deacetylase (regulator of RNase III)
MIRVAVGELAAFRGEGVLRPIRSDLEPTTAGSRIVEDRAGASIRERLEAAGEIPVGGAVITPGGELEARFVIHVVTSSRDEAEAPTSVQRALRNGLRRAADWGLESLAVPPLGTGVGVMELEDAARVQVEILVDHLAEGAPPLELTVVVANSYEEDVFSRLVATLAGEAPPTGATSDGTGGSVG